MLKQSLNRLVRLYLRRFPITEGKSQIFRFTKDLLTPEDPFTRFHTKYRFRLTANLQDHKHLRLYFYGTHDERYETSKYLKIIRKGDICWDVGANIGFYTCLFASLVGETGTVVAFEPAATTFSYLTENVQLNNFGNVKALKKALGDQREQRRIYYSHPSLAEETASLKYTQGHCESEIVDVDTIDNAITHLPAPDVIKIDVEGYQMEVLQGGRHFFRDNPPIVIVELKDSADANAHCLSDIGDEIAEMGYNIYEIGKYSLKRCNNPATAKGRNCLLVNEKSPQFSRIAPFL